MTKTPEQQLRGLGCIRGNSGLKIPILCPLAGIGFDVVPDLAVVVLRAYDVLMEGFLPQKCPGLFGSPAFHVANDGADRRGGYQPPGIVTTNA